MILKKGLRAGGVEKFHVKAIYFFYPAWAGWFTYLGSPTFMFWQALSQLC